MKIVKNDLFDYKNRYIFQYDKAFKFSLDSILLAEFVKDIKSSDKVVDLCTGNAPVPLILTTKYENDITCFELQKEIYELAYESIKYNSLESKINLINDNIKHVDKYLDKGSIDVITCNPPYFKKGESKVLSDNDLSKIARHEIEITVEDIFKISKNLLNNNGILYMVHRSNRVDELILLANKYKMNIKELVFIATKEDNINTVLIKCVKNSKMGIKIKYKNVFNLKTYQNMF